MPGVSQKDTYDKLKSREPVAVLLRGPVLCLAALQSVDFSAEELNVLYLLKMCLFMMILYGYLLLELFSSLDKPLNSSLWLYLGRCSFLGHQSKEMACFCRLTI